MMAKRYIGDAVITIENVGRTDDNRANYAGTVRVGKYTWKFDDLASGVGGVSSGRGYGYPDDSPEAYDKMAGSAVSFASYYSGINRGDDVPEWAPPPEVADAIEEAVSYAQRDDGEYEVRRSPKGKVHEEEAVMHEVPLSEARHRPSRRAGRPGFDSRGNPLPGRRAYMQRLQPPHHPPARPAPAPAPTRSAHHAPPKKR
jgi:hypothetical protein